MLAVQVEPEVLNVLQTELRRLVKWHCVECHVAGKVRILVLNKTAVELANVLLRPMRMRT